MYVCVLLYPYIISNTSPKNMKQKLTELKGKTDTSIIIDFNISLTIINRKARQKIGEGNGTPLQYSCLENPMNGGAWQAAVHGVAKSQTGLKRLHFHFSLSCIGEGNGNPLQYSCLGNPRDGGAWWAAIYGVAKSQTQLKRLSSSSNQKLKKKRIMYNILKGK